MLAVSNKISKLDYGNYLSAALAYLMINQQDGVGLTLFDNQIQTFIPPRSKPSHVNTILTHLDKTGSGKDTDVGIVLHEMAERIKKRGLIILISDLFDETENIINGLKHFRHNKQEIIVFHVMDRKELNFDFSNRTKFKDMETDEQITTEPWKIRKIYQKAIQSYQDELRLRCREQKIDYVPLFTDQNLDLALNEYLKKRQRLG